MEIVLSTSTECSSHQACFLSKTYLVLLQMPEVVVADILLIPKMYKVIFTVKLGQVVHLSTILAGSVLYMLY